MDLVYDNQVHVHILPTIMATVNFLPSSSSPDHQHTACASPSSYVLLLHRVCVVYTCTEEKLKIWL